MLLQYMKCAACVRLVSQDPSYTLQQPYQLDIWPYLYGLSVVCRIGAGGLLRSSEHGIRGFCGKIACLSQTNEVDFVTS